MSNYYLGIDVSKGYADFILLNDQKQPLDDGIQFDDTRAGHHKLLVYLNEFLGHHPDGVIYAALESTGGYENNWYHCFASLAERMPLFIARLNPFRVKSNSQAGARHNKTDAISARDIAEYQIAHPEKIRYNEDQSYSSLRRQWNFIQLNLKQHGQLTNHLESLLYTSMPEVLTLTRQGIPRWLLTVLKKYPTYETLRAGGVEKLCQIPFVPAKKARRLIALVEKGIGRSDPISGQIIATLAEQILTLDRRIKQHKKLLEKNYSEARREIELLLTFKGIGVYSAVGLLLNIISIQRFPTVKQLAAYFGLHPVYKQSGDGSWGFHMSKQGRAEPRAILYMVSWSACQHNPIIKDLYTHCLKKGMPPQAALGVCMHKIVRIIYGMLKNNTPFDPQIDRQNREKNQIQNQPPRPDKKRRLQPFDEQAPISRRQFKKRKEQTLSQDEKLVTCGIREPVPSS